MPFNERQFIDAAFPESYTILGNRLLPFSLGHSILLRRFDCSFLVGGEVGVEDLLLGIVVCSKTFKEGGEFFSDPEWAKTVFDWGKRMHKPRIFGKRRVIDWPSKVELFKKYIDAGLKMPGLKYEAGGGEVGSPWEERLIQTMLNLGHKVEDVYDMSLPLLWIRYFTHLESSSGGSIRFKTRDDYELEEMAANMGATV